MHCTLSVYFYVVFSQATQVRFVFTIVKKTWNCIIIHNITIELHVSCRMFGDYGNLLHPRSVPKTSLICHSCNIHLSMFICLFCGLFDAKMLLYFIDNVLVSRISRIKKYSRSTNYIFCFYFFCSDRCFFVIVEKYRNRIFIIFKQWHDASRQMGATIAWHQI